MEREKGRARELQIHQHQFLEAYWNKEAIQKLLQDNKRISATMDLPRTNSQGPAWFPARAGRQALHRQEEQQRGICHGALLEDVARPPKDGQERQQSSTAPVRREEHTEWSSTGVSVQPATVVEMLINELTKGIEAVLIKSTCNMQEKEKGWLQACRGAELLIHNNPD